MKKEDLVRGKKLYRKMEEKRVIQESKQTSLPEGKRTQMCRVCGKKYLPREIQLGAKPITFFDFDCDCLDLLMKYDAIRRRGIEEREKIRTIKNCGIPERFKSATFRNFKVSANLETAYAKTLKYARFFPTRYLKGKGLFLCGSVGSGKTHLAVGIVDHIARMHKDLIKERALSIVFKSSVTMIHEIKTLIQQRKNIDEYISVLEACDLLILDDFGAEKETEWTSETLYKIINTRYERRRPIILTTNLSPEALPRNFSKRITSRIFEMCDGIKVQSDDYRLNR